MSFLTLRYPNTFLIRKIEEGKFSNSADLVDVLEDFVMENNSDILILRQYYKNIVLKFYAEVYSLTLKGETNRDVFLRENSIFFFMHDFLSHIFYGHTIDVIGDQRVHEARNSLTVKYNPFEIIVKFFIDKNFFLDYFHKKGYILSNLLHDHLESFFPEYEKIVVEYDESELLKVFVKALLAHIDNNQYLIEEICVIASIISHEQNLRRVCVYQLFDDIQALLEGVSKEQLEMNLHPVSSITYQLNATYERIINIAERLDFAAVKLDLHEVLNLYDIDKIDYERKRSSIEDALFTILTSPNFVSKINNRLSFLDIPIRIPLVTVIIR